MAPRLASERSAQAPIVPAAIPRPTEISSARVPPEESRAPVEPFEAEAPPATRPPMAEIRASFAFEGGAPAAGVRCQVEGWGGNEERVRKYGEPVDWIDPAGVSDAAGQLSLRFDPPRAFQFALEAKLPGFGGVSWRWREIEPGATVDLGTVTMRRGATIEGRLVDRKGSPQHGAGWMVYARSSEAGSGRDRDQSQVIVGVDGSGSYRAEDVLPGRVELSAHSRIANWVDGPSVTVQSGETLNVDIVYAGPDNARRITLRTSSKPFHVMSSPDPSHVTLRFPDGEIRTAAEIAGSAQSLSFEDLDPGSYALEIDDPRYLPWSLSDVHPGESPSARLEGSAAIELVVSDAEGRPVSPSSVRVEFRNVNFFPREFEVEPQEGLLRGLFPGDYTVRVKADGLLGATEVDGLAAGERRMVTLQLGTGNLVAGRVVHPDRVPVADVEVLLLLPAGVDDSASSPIQRRTAAIGGSTERYRKEVESAATDANGCFQFVLARPGSYVIRASAGGTEVSSEVLRVSGTELGHVDLVLPRGGRLRGALRTAGGEDFRAFRIALDPVLAAGEDLFLSARATARRVVEVEAGGRFESGALPVGPVEVFLLLPEREFRQGRGSWTNDQNQNRIRLGQVTIEEGIVAQQDFEVPEFPGRLAFEVRVNGEPAAGLRLQARGALGSGFQLDGVTDAKGSFGPALAFGGEWSVTVSDPEQGWSHAAPVPFQVRPSSETRATIQVAVSTARLRFLDRESGEPLVARPIALRDPSSPFVRPPARKTDAKGEASFTLTPGDYVFVLDPAAPFSPAAKSERLSAPLTWTSQGPLTDWIEL